MPLSPIIAGHLLEVKCYTSLGEQLGITTVHMKVNSAAAGTTPDDIVAAAEADWNGSFKPWLGTAAEWRGLSIRDLTVFPLEIAAFSAVQRGPGTGGLELPTQLRGLITKRTAVAGPRGRGRMYIPFPGANMAIGRHVSVAGQAVLQTMIDDMKGPEAQVSGAFNVNWTMVLRTTADPLVTNYPIRAFDISAEFATQQRSGFYGQPNTAPSPLL